MTSQSFFKFSLFSFLAVIIDCKSEAAQDITVQGLWKTQDGRAKIRIHPCSYASELLCGTIDELREPIDPKTGHEKTDQFNPEDEMKSRKLKGLMNLADFKAVSEDPYHWVDGKIYSPREGKTYSCKMELSSDGNLLTVQGYIVSPVFGQTQTWTRTTSEEKLTVSSTDK